MQHGSDGGDEPVGLSSPSGIGTPGWVTSGAGSRQLISRGPHATALNSEYRDDARGVAFTG